MPAPAVYVLAIIGTVGAVIAFKELVYEPHIAPAIDRWKAEYQERRRLRQLAADVPMTERGQPTGNKRPSKSRTSGDGKYSDSEDDDVDDSRGPDSPPAGSTSNLRMSGGLLRRSGPGRAPSPPAKETERQGLDLELDNLAAREVNEWRSGQDLRFRKNVSSVGHAMDESVHPLPYTPLSPSRTHVVYDSDSPSTPSNASWTASPAPPTLPLCPGIPNPTRSKAINPFEDPRNEISDNSGPSRAKSTPSPGRPSPSSSTPSSVAPASTSHPASSPLSEISPNAPLPPPKDTYQPLQTQQGSKPVSPPSQVPPFQPTVPQSLLLGNSVTPTNFSQTFNAPPSASAPSTTSRTQTAPWRSPRLPPLPPSPAQHPLRPPQPPPAAPGPTSDVTTTPQILPYQQYPHNIPSLSQSYPQETDYEHGLELVSPPSSRSESPFSMAELSPMPGAGGGLRVLSPSGSERGSGTDDGFYTFSPLSEGGRALGSGSGGGGASAGVTIRSGEVVFSPPESLTSSPWVSRPASSLGVHGLPGLAGDRNGSFDTLSPLVGHQSLGVGTGPAVTATSRASHATASHTESEYHSFSESEWAEDSSRSSSIMGWNSEDGDGASNSFRFNAAGAATNVNANAVTDATATPTRNAFQPRVQPQPRFQLHTLTQTQLLADPFSPLDPHAPGMPPISSFSPAVPAPAHTHADPPTRDRQGLLSPPSMVFRPRTGNGSEDVDADLSDLDFMSDYAMSEGGTDAFSGSGAEGEGEGDAEGNESASDSGWSWTSGGTGRGEGAQR